MAMPSPARRKDPKAKVPITAKEKEISPVTRKTGRVSPKAANGSTEAREDQRARPRRDRGRPREGRLKEKTGIKERTGTKARIGTKEKIGTKGMTVAKLRPREMTDEKLRPKVRRKNRPRRTEKDRAAKNKAKEQPKRRSNIIQRIRWKRHAACVLAKASRTLHPWSRMHSRASEAHRGRAGEVQGL